MIYKFNENIGYVAKSNRKNKTFVILLYILLYAIKQCYSEIKQDNEIDCDCETRIFEKEKLFLARCLLHRNIKDTCIYTKLYNIVLNYKHVYFNSMQHYYHVDKWLRNNTESNSSVTSLGCTKKLVIIYITYNIHNS